MELHEAFQKAAELAKQVPENLQQAAFNRALDQLLGDASSSQIPARRMTSVEKSPREEPEADDLIEKIDRTKYPDIGATPRVADRALKILALAQEDYEVDGLTGAQIADILTKKFRLGVAANTVNMALQRETDTVDVRNRNGIRIFHLMAPGEDYLKRLRTGEVTGQKRAGAPPPTKRGARQKKASNRKAKQKSSPSPESDNASPDKKVAAAKKAHGTRRPGPKAALEQLLNSGYFDTPRIIADIREYLRHKRGHAYTLQDLSPTLVRLVRDEKLDRDRNASGQYEYTRAK